VLISLRWIDELLEGDALDADQTAEALTSLGLEVEGIHRHPGLPNVVVGEVRSVEPHPKADRLNVVQLFDGTDEVQVVCGATNLPPAGGKVAFAQVGAVLPGEFEIGARKLRGVDSSGMICSEKELEIGPDGDGIMVLPQTWRPGTRLDEVVPEIIDTVIEISVTPNRPDALGHVGVARDLGVKLRRGFVRPAALSVEQAAAIESRDDLVEMRTPANAACGRYLGFALDGVKVGPSPLGLRVRLHRVGLRPINNVVDVTNVVLMEYAQPQHAFDRAHLAEDRIVVRMAAPGETLETLDGTTVDLVASDLVIADAKRPQALAGVMGGEDSSVDEDTDRALLEVAWFKPTAVRTSARRYGFHTDSSHRFERQVDHGEGLDEAARRALHLLAELAQARCVGRHEVRGELPAPVEIRLRHARITSLLGIEIEQSQAVRILTGLGIELDGPNDGAWTCRPPSCRPDLTREVDLIEEVMRHHGLDSMAAVPAMPTSYGEDTERPQVYAAADRLIDGLVERGYHEHVGFAFTGPEALGALGDAVDPALAVRVSNPMRSQHSLMRMHLLPGLIDAAALNLSRHGRPVRLCEFGRIYDWGGTFEGEAATSAVDARLPRQRLRLALICAPPHGASVAEIAEVAREVATDLQHAVRRLGLEARTRPWGAEAPHRRPELHPGVQARLEVRAPGSSWAAMGVVGEVHPNVLDAWDLPAERRRLVFAEVAIDGLPTSREVQDRALPRFPSTSRDLSLEIPTKVPVSQLLDVLEASAREIEGSTETDDPVRLAEGDESAWAITALEDYRGQGVEDGRKAILLRLSYRAAERTVTDDEVQDLHDAIVKLAVARLEANGIDVRRR